ncbi:MAG: hypothetical protein MJ016_00935 [Victivallaceae bacterium]|nr:hypothetical protein [Victivallaceae bacterium]
MAKQFIIRSPRLDRAVNESVRGYTSNVHQGSRPKGAVVGSFARGGGYVARGVFDLVIEKNDSGGSVILCNSAIPSSSIAGAIYAGNEIIRVAKTVLPLEAGYVYVSVTLDSRDRCVADVKTTPELPPDQDEREFVEVIGEVVIGDEGTASIAMNRPLENIRITDRWL